MPTPPEQLEQEITDGFEILPKRDEAGRMYREVRCPYCRAWLCDEYVRVGRLRFKCRACGKIMIMVIHPRRSPEGSDQ